MLCAKFDFFGSGEEDKHVKSLQQRPRRRKTTDIFLSEKLTRVFGFGELKMLNHNLTTL